MSLEAKRFYEFKNFRLDPDEGVLMRDGKPLPVTPKAFHLLKILVERHGRLVGKDELISALWADSHVEEGNLAFNVRVLRKALGDSAAQPTFIETVPRRGYRFVAAVTEVSEDHASRPAAGAGSEAGQPPFFRPRRRRYFLFAAAALVLMIGSATGSWYFLSAKAVARTSPPILSAPFRSEKISSSGTVHNAAISPDGKLAAYTEGTGGKYGVWLRRLETSENFQVLPPSADYYHGLAFARDGQSLFFVRKPADDDAPAAVYRVSIFGGVPEKIAEKTEGWISLSPDDRQVSFVRCAKTDEDYCSLFAADAGGGGGGGNERRLVTRARPFRIGDNQFSPDGRSIAFAVGQSSGGGSDFRLLKLDLETGEERQLSPKVFFNIKNLKWLPGGEDLLLTATETLDGKFKIWRVSAATGEAEPLTEDATSYSTFSLNDRADKMIATRVANNFRLYVGTAGGEMRVLTSGRSMTFAPDGGRIVYTSDGNDIWTINRDGSQQRQLTNNAASNFYPKVSPDGRLVFFTSNRTGANHVWRMNADGGDQKRLTEKEGGYPVSVTPDGKWVYYRSGLRETLWRVSTEGGGGETQIFEQKVYSPAVTADASLVAYLFRDQGGLRIGVMNAADGKIVRTISPPGGKPFAASLAWGADGRTLYFTTRQATANSLWRLSPDEKEPRFVASLGEGEVPDLALAPDGETFAFIRGEWFHDAVLIEGLR